MGKICGIHHLCINTPDIDRSIAFYRDLLGFSLLSREDCSFGAYAMLTQNGTRLELIQPINSNENSFGNKGSLAHFGIAVQNIREVVAELRRKGVQFLSEEIEDADAPMGGLYAISLLGPSDEAINLYEFKKAF